MLKIISFRFQISVLLAALIGFASGCSTTGAAILKIDTGDLVGVQYMPQEISRMLDDLGYDWIPVYDPAIRQPVKVAEQYGQYRMRFQARDRSDIRIDVHIRITGNTTTLRFHEVAAKDATSVSEKYYRKLRDRLVLEFGPENVSGGPSILSR